ncbi:N-acetylmuramoyl-L-alanine amidase family protein [Candidatus Arthromitus sp. SFB-rat-Yit]|uniref:N-acetylmuramoyl-L-alanine amidase family protein n=1 Tax=Candidatus Arthromitus sp. SFB-rat-Yit TaxID=1041504 RepID=UPI000227A046|nr:N-acetylmuramoyl-L-alanine amidase [Candidatus Arthromitus sp. SFB-rat-Yit]BAK80714.1 N-acetylmuramoyl-L-alanine amidase [Candidatus Arthromitus sp. SFB-rat-Yit]
MKKLILVVVFISLILGVTSLFKYSLSTKELEGVSLKKVVVIDAGHGGFDTGSIGYSKTKEKDITLSIALNLGEKLNEDGFIVYYTRDKDVSLGKNERDDLNVRIKMINSLKPDIFLSIHLNGSDYKSAKGIETYTRESDDKSYLLGESIQDELSSVEYTTDRGVKTTKDRKLAILDRTKHVGILLELGFITNKSDEEYLVSKSGQNTVIECILSGISTYFNKIL